MTKRLNQFGGIFEANAKSDQVPFDAERFSLNGSQFHAEINMITWTYPIEFVIVSKNDIWRAVAGSDYVLPTHAVSLTNLRVKFVPKLGPLAVARLSKKATASSRQKNVADSKPPYPPFAVRHSS
jgi:hypothetical protein